MQRAGTHAKTGTTEQASAQKKGYKVPRGLLTNADLTRLINSDEIQSIVRPPKTGTGRRVLKKNPLKNLGALLKLNPYAKSARRAELLQQARSFAKFAFGPEAMHGRLVAGPEATHGCLVSGPEVLTWLSKCIAVALALPIRLGRLGLIFPLRRCAKCMALVAAVGRRLEPEKP